MAPAAPGAARDRALDGQHPHVGLDRDPVEQGVAERHGLRQRQALDGEVGGVHTAIVGGPRHRRWTIRDSRTLGRGQRLESSGPRPAAPSRTAPDDPRERARHAAAPVGEHRRHHAADGGLRGLHPPLGAPGVCRRRQRARRGARSAPPRRPTPRCATTWPRRRPRRTPPSLRPGSVAPLAGKDLGLPGDSSGLAGAVTAVQSRGSAIVTITARSGDPQQASDLANAWVRALSKRAKELESLDGGKPLPRSPPSSRRWCRPSRCPTAAVASCSSRACSDFCSGWLTPPCGP